MHSSPLFKAITAAVAEQARSRPQAIALATDRVQFTYTELDEAATQCAHSIRSREASEGQIIAIALERSPEFVVAALAIMKCGAAYLPMDLAHPAERLRFIVRSAAVRLVVTNQQSSHLFRDSEVEVVLFETGQIEAQSTEPSPNELNADDLAYVIYTSGSTGEPKGVEVTHRNLSNLIAWHTRAFALDENTRATFLAGVGFDAAVWEIWPHLTIGAAIFLPDDATRVSPQALRDWLVAQRITISFVPTAMAEQLIALPWPKETALRFLLTGADTLHRYPPADLPFALVNNYGPTECTVVATSGRVTASAKSDRPPSIGSAIDNVHIHILDEQLQKVTYGAIGEICVGGAGVARGYRNRPQLTAERFVADPFCDKGGRLYRTGDLGRQLANGEIEFIGRTDDQVKIRGYRIELGEINAALNEQASVQAGIVVARDEAPGEKRLVAYVVSTPGTPHDEQILRDAIRRRLPDYMEPTAFVWMESLPLTANGKIDRAALPAPSFDTAGEFIGPRNPIEETLGGIIKDVLKLPQVSVNDDFFRLGAHSMFGAQVIAHVSNVFGAELKLLDVFDAPTVAQLSAKIEEALTSKVSAMSGAEVDAALAALNENAAN